ncbi:Hint domain-containing protein [Aestuariibius sp. 2305UL40-4]|uniref:Hint domain-containing protein n=1 Tax=Aestuariibius violaceus TaxID=3234132 RepID=UPI00345EDAAF
MTFMSKIGDRLADCAVTGVSADALLRTPCGARRAEFIRSGDLVVTRDNGLQPVRAVWTRTITRADMQADPSRCPVHLAPRVVGPMMPQRPLTLAPDHKILVPAYLLSEIDAKGGLLKARTLTDLTEGARLDREAEEITFYNVVFDTPQIVMASGLPVETYHVCADRLADVPERARETLVQTFPILRGTGDPVPALAYPTVGAEQYARSVA